MYILYLVCSNLINKILKILIRIMQVLRLVYVFMSAIKGVVSLIIMIGDYPSLWMPVTPGIRINYRIADLNNH